MLTDPNKYKIVVTRYTAHFDEETVVLHEGGLLENMQYLFSQVKDRQGANLIKIELVDLNGDVLACYP
jgi:hypothetical protein